MRLRGLIDIRASAVSALPVNPLFLESLVSRRGRVGPEIEAKDEKNAADHIDIPSMVRLFAARERYCNTNRMLVGNIDHAHFRRIPRMLTKKLEKTV